MREGREGKSGYVYHLVDLGELDLRSARTVQGNARRPELGVVVEDLRPSHQRVAIQK